MRGDLGALTSFGASRGAGVAGGGLFLLLPRPPVPDCTHVDGCCCGGRDCWPSICFPSSPRRSRLCAFVEQRVGSAPLPWFLLGSFPLGSRIRARPAARACSRWVLRQSTGAGCRAGMGLPLLPQLPAFERARGWSLAPLASDGRGCGCNSSSSSSSAHLPCLPSTARSRNIQWHWLGLPLHFSAAPAERSLSSWTTSPSRSAPRWKRTRTPALSA
jgi:hypothetical protein